jgi:hypothetical protein
VRNFTVQLLLEASHCWQFLSRYFVLYVFVLALQGKGADRRAKEREAIEYTEEILVTKGDLEVL